MRVTNFEHTTKYLVDIICFVTNTCNINDLRVPKKSTKAGVHLTLIICYTLPSPNFYKSHQQTNCFLVVKCYNQTQLTIFFSCGRLCSPFPGYNDLENEPVFIPFHINPSSRLSLNASVPKTIFSSFCSSSLNSSSHLQTL